MRKCAVCKKEGKFFIGRTIGKTGEKKFGYVCPQHDRYFGRQNLVRVGLTMQEAVAFERK